MLKSQVVILVSFGLIAIGAGALLAYFALPSTAPDVLASVYISWVFGLATVLLLPYDISLALDRTANNEDDLSGVWSTIYWLTFSLAWILLPIQMEYHASGEFSAVAKLKDALHKLFMFALLFAAALIVYVIYELITTEKATVQIEDFLMAIGNTYGVLLLVVLAGSGLIGVPRRLWEMTETDSELERCWLIAPQTEEVFQDARFSLEDVENEALEVCGIVEEAMVCSRNDLLAADSKVTKEEILLYTSILRETVASFEPEGKVKRRSRKPSSSTTPPFDMQEVAATTDTDRGLLIKSRLVESHASLKRAQLRFQASHRRWRSLLESAVALESVLDMHEEMGISSSDLSAGGGTLYANMLRFLRRDKLQQLFLRSLSLCCLALSVLILSCELLMSTDVTSPLGWLVDGIGEGTDDTQESGSLGVQVICFFALAYLAVCTFYSLFCMNIGYDYSLSGPRSSGPSSLLFNGCYSARLQFALGYNFILMLNTDRLDGTAFSTLMEDMQTIPVAGTSLNVYVPLVILLVFFVALFRQYQRLVSLVPGFEVEGMLDRSCCYCLSSGTASQSKSSEELETIETGKSLIDAEKKRLRAAAAAGTATAVGAARDSLPGKGISTAAAGGTRNPMVQVRAPSVMETLKMRAVEMAGQGQAGAAGHTTRPAPRGYDHLDISLTDDEEEDREEYGAEEEEDEERPTEAQRHDRGHTNGDRAGGGGSRVMLSEEEESAFSGGGRYSGM